MASTSCFLHTYAPSTSKTPPHRLIPRPAAIICRVQKKTQENNIEDGDSAVSRRLALTFLVGTTAVGLKANTADAAYGDAANVFGKPKGDTEFQQYKGEGFQILIPSKWNKSKEVEFPGQVLRYEDNFDTISNVSVIIQPTDKSKITDYNSPEDFLAKFDYLLGKQAFFGKTDSEGGFESSAVATANILETDTPVIKGNQYYLISVLARTADGNEGGKHQLITATVKDGKLYICRAQAGDKRWFKGARKSVETAANSFNVA